MVVNKVRMIRTVPVSIDGLRTDIWRAGTNQHPTDAMLQILIGEGAVEIIENKANNAAPENKKRGKRR
jgi:hypothetical protein